MNSEIYNIVVKKLKGGECDPCEFINQAYLDLFEAGEEVSEKSLLNKARALMRTAIGFVSKKASRDTTQVCLICKQCLPMGAFLLYFSKIKNTKIAYVYCIDCQREYNRKYQAAQKEMATDVYVRSLIRKTFKGAITAEMITERRAGLLSYRKGGARFSIGSDHCGDCGDCKTQLNSSNHMAWYCKTKKQIRRSPYCNECRRKRNRGYYKKWYERHVL